MGKLFEFYEDADGTGSIDSIRDQKNSDRWVKSREESLALGFTNSAYWVRFTLKNEGNNDIDLYIEQGYALINNLKLFEPDERGFGITEIGNRKPFFNRPVKYRTLVFPVRVRAGAEKTCYLRYKTEGAMNIRLVIWQREAFQETKYSEDIILWMFYGIMLIMALYNLFLFVSIRDMTYLYLIMQIVFMSLLMMNLQGISFQYLWPNSIQWAVISYPFFNALVGFASFQFFRYFLRTMDQTRIGLKRVDFVLKAMMLISLFMALLTLATGNYRISNLATSVLAVVDGIAGTSITLFYVFTPGPWARRIKFYLAAWSIFIAGTFMYALKTFALLPDVFITNYTMQIGAVCEVAILSFALADTINVMKNNLEDLNVHLEDKIRDRTDELQASNDKLKEMDKVKSNFFTNLSHEIKTPLTLIANFLDEYIARRGTSDELSVVQKYVGKLMQDMMNLFDVLKFERGISLYDHDLIADLSDLIRQKVELFTSLAYRRDITVTSDIDEGLYVKADPLAIERIANNLIDNALRYNRSGGSMTVSLKAEKDRVLFAVSDTGIGIAGDQLSTIFEPYFQISHEKRNIQGIGLGLSLVKSIVNSLDGTISVESSIGVGTTFTLCLRRHMLIEGERPAKEILSVQHLAPLPSMQEPEAEYSGNWRRRALIVEDNPDLMKLMRKKIGERYDVISAANGNEALKRCSAMEPDRPDVIVSDIMMDEMDGYELFERIIEKEEYRDVPFIFVTAKSSPDDRIEGLKRGAVDYVTKPFAMEELIARIDAIMRHQEIRNESFEKDKFASLGMLLGGISHEIFNPLSGITGPMENLRKIIDATGLGENEKVMKYFRNMRDSTGKIEGIINNIRTLYSHHSLETGPVDIAGAARLAVAAFEKEHSGRISFDINIEEGLVVNGNREAIEQILRNLIANAVDAISGSGSVTVTAKRTGTDIAITVTDTGCGIAPENIGSVFNAFYTTKDTGKNSGLGLNIVKNLVLKMGWKILAKSALNSGTTFYIEARNWNG